MVPFDRALVFYRLSNLSISNHVAICSGLAAVSNVKLPPASC